jgi:hypothetical protein
LGAACRTTCRMWPDGSFVAPSIAISTRTPPSVVLPGSGPEIERWALVFAKQPLSGPRRCDRLLRFRISRRPWSCPCLCRAGEDGVYPRSV